MSQAERRPGAPGTGAAEENTTPQVRRHARNDPSGSAVGSGLLSALARAVEMRPLATHRWAWRAMDRNGREWATRQFLGDVADALWGTPCSECGRQHDGPDGGCLL